MAILAGEPVGWCAVEPRISSSGLLRFRVPWADRAEDGADPAVWAVTCFLTRVGYRRRGIGGVLARGTVDYVSQRGARAGFRELSRPTPRRLVMRVGF